MATFEGRDTTRATQESLFYERCWRCRCVVPNGLVRRRTMKTGYSTGTMLGTGAAVADLDHYEAVSLCGVCYEELETAARHQREKSYRRWAFWGRLIGIAYGTIQLNGVGIAFAPSLTIMVTHAYFRILGRAIVTMHITGAIAGLLRYMPDRYGTHVMASWGIIWAGLIGWQLWYPENRPWPFRHVPQNEQTKPVNHKSVASAASLPSGGPPS